MEERLWLACRDGRLNEVKEILRSNPGVDVNWRSKDDGSTGLHLACLNGHSLIVSLLLAHPDITDVNQKDKFGQTSFYYACFNGKWSVVSVMLKDARVLINEPANDGYTPLSRAALFGHLEAIKWLIVSGRELDLGEAGNEYNDAVGVARMNNETSVASLLERFKKNRAQTTTEIKAELGINDFLVVSPPKPTRERYFDFLNGRPLPLATFNPGAAPQPIPPQSYTLEPWSSSTTSPTVSEDLVPMAADVTELNVAAISVGQDVTELCTFVATNPKLAVINFTGCDLVAPQIIPILQGLLQRVELHSLSKIQVDEIEYGSSSPLTLEILCQVSRGLMQRRAKLIRGGVFAFTTTMEVNFKKDSPLGEGSYGTVFKGKWLGRDVAFKLARPYNSKASLQLKREASYMTLLGFHPHIVRCFGVFVESATKSPVMIMERMAGDLSKLLKENRNLDEPTRLDLAHQIARGLNVLHGIGVIHRDLKPGNILYNLINERFYIKIADFGSSLTVNEFSGSTLASVQGTMAYLPPEIRMSEDDMEVDDTSYEGDSEQGQKERKYSKEADLWALGIIIYQIMNADYKTPTKLGSYRGLPENPPLKFIEPKTEPLIRQCLSKRENRPTVSLVLQSLDALQHEDRLISAAQSGDILSLQAWFLMYDRYTTPAILACALFEAVSANQLHSTTELLRHGANPNVSVPKQSAAFPLAVALQSQSLALVGVLLLGGAKPLGDSSENEEVNRLLCKWDPPNENLYIPANRPQTYVSGTFDVVWPEEMWEEAFSLLNAPRDRHVRYDNAMDTLLHHRRFLMTNDHWNDYGFDITIRVESEGEYKGVLKKAILIVLLRRGILTRSDSQLKGPTPGPAPTQDQIYFMNQLVSLFC